MTTTPMPGVNSAILDVPRSGIREISDLAWARKDVLRLELGEPNFPTPAHIVEAAHSAARAGMTKYTPSIGIPALREALATALRARHPVTTQTDEVLVTHGAVSAVFAAMAAMLSRGDGILIPEPSWPNYVVMARLLGADVQRYAQSPANDFLPTIADLERVVTSGTRVLLINSPSNPLGAVIPQERMAELVAFAQQRGLWIISDECYDQICFTANFSSPLEMAPDRVVSAYSFSKTYAMTGWRVGYAVAPPALRPEIAKVLEGTLTCVNAPAQAAALAAITGPQEFVRQAVEAYRSRRDRALESFAGARMLPFTPSGAFYLWVGLGAAGISARDFAVRLLEEESVAIAPGSAFGENSHQAIRISLANDEETLDEAIRRIKAFHARLVDSGSSLDSVFQQAQQARGHL